MIAIPRVGQEVVIHFLHGDPDQPMVTGRTYHAVNRAALKLPMAKTQMVLRSKTHKGEGYNELRFEDAKGREGLFLRAQRDMTTQVLNNRVTEVGANHTETITGHQHTTLTEGHRHIEVQKGNDSKVVASGALSEQIAKAKTINADSLHVAVAASQGEASSGHQVFVADQSIAFGVGKSQIVLKPDCIIINIGDSVIQLSESGITINGKIVLINSNEMQRQELVDDIKYQDYEPTHKEVLFSLRHPIAAYHIGSIDKGKNNISTIAHRFASSGTGKYVLQYHQDNGSTEGTEVNAFRHTIWQAAITSTYGKEIAKEAGDAHEVNPNAHLSSSRLFDTMAEADQSADLMNNIIGRNIGESNKNKNMQELSLLVLDDFFKNGLYVVTKNKQEKFLLEKRLIIKEKYEYLKSYYDELNENGRPK